MEVSWRISITGEEVGLTLTKITKFRTLYLKKSLPSFEGRISQNRGGRGE
ncbi:hypothetical protein JCM12825_00950 [Desulfurobacterium crinifex]